MRALLLGRKPVASEALQLLLQRGVDVLAVVAPQPPEVSEEATFWRPLLRDTARELGIPVVRDAVLYQSLAALESGRTPELDLQDVDLVLSVLFWRRIEAPLIQLPRLGCFNFHPGPLPAFRGRRGYNFAILENCAEYGASVHWVEPGFDTGDLVEVRTFPIGPDETALSLESLTMECLREMFSDFVDARLAGRPIARTPQGEGRSATRAEMLAASRILPTDDGEMIGRKIRAFWYPPHAGATLTVGNREYTLVDAEILSKLGRFLHGSRERPT